MEVALDRLKGVLLQGSIPDIRATLLQQGLTPLEENECIHAAIERNDPAVWAALLQCGIDPDCVVYILEHYMLHQLRKRGMLRELAPSLQRAGLTPTGLDRLRELVGDASAWEGRRRDVLMFRQAAREPGPALTRGSMERRFGTLATFRTFVEQDDADGVAALIQEDRVPPAAVTSAAYRAAASGKTRVLAAILARDPPRVGWAVAEGLFAAIGVAPEVDTLVASIAEEVAPHVSPASGRDMLEALFFVVNHTGRYGAAMHLHPLMQRVIRACGVTPHSDFFEGYALILSREGALDVLAHGGPQSSYARAVAIQQYAMTQELFMDGALATGLDVARHGASALAGLLHNGYTRAAMDLLGMKMHLSGPCAAYDIALSMGREGDYFANYLRRQGARPLLPEDSALRHAIETSNVAVLEELLNAGACVRGPGPELNLALKTLRATALVDAGPGDEDGHNWLEEALQILAPDAPARVVVHMLLDAGASLYMHDEPWIMRVDPDIAHHMMQRRDAAFPHTIADEMQRVGRFANDELQVEVLHFALHQARAPASRREQCGPDLAWSVGGAKRPRAPGGPPPGAAKRPATGSGAAAAAGSSGWA
jgi:hypothetical protein